MTGPDFARARAYAIEQLEKLPRELGYHSRWHTCSDVAPAVARLARAEQVAGAALVLLKTAAYYHDIGFVLQDSGHEAAGVRIAGAVLPGFGYDRAATDAIGAMIMATRLPQAPADLLGQILADADLDVLGRADFLDRNRLLRQELAARGRPTTDQQWLRAQISFLEGHRYWTAAARQLRDSRKRANLAALRAQLGRGSGAQNE